MTGLRLPTPHRIARVEYREAPGPLNNLVGSYLRRNHAGGAVIRDAPSPCHKLLVGVLVYSAWCCIAPVVWATGLASAQDARWALLFLGLTGVGFLVFGTTSFRAVVRLRPGTVHVWWSVLGRRIREQSIQLDGTVWRLYWGPVGDKRDDWRGFGLYALGPRDRAVLLAYNLKREPIEAIVRPWAALAPAEAGPTGR